MEINPKKEIKILEQIFGGIIKINGIEYNGITYPYQWIVRINNVDYTVFYLSSFHKHKITEFIGRKVVFKIDDKNQACGVGLINDSNVVINI